MLRRFTNERGSVLVAVIAFAIIISIAAGGLLMLAANSVGNETDELDDYQAQLAAESGLAMGLRWLAVPATWTAMLTKDTSCTYTVNDMADTVSTSRDVNGRLVLSSHAANSRMKYVKMIACNVDSSLAFGLATNSWDSAFPDLDNIWFDGPVHSNTPLQMANASISTSKRGNVYLINGIVTVRDTITVLPSYGFGRSGNDYNYGIDIENPFSRDGGRGNTLDKYFDNVFEYTRDSVVVPWPNLNGIIPLPLNYTLNINNKAVLYFDTVTTGVNLIGYATYYYFIGNTLQPPHLIQNIDNQIILLQNPVDVLGVVKGKATVITPLGCDIHPVGDLNYADFTKMKASEIANYNNYNPITNYGISPSSTNYLALISGGNIHFRSGNEKRFDDAHPGVLKDTIVTGGTNIWVTAAFYATKPGTGILWDTISGSPNIQLSAFNFNIFAIGSRKVDRFINYPSRCSNAAANTQFRFYYDRRFDNNLPAPGVPAFRRITPSGNNLYFLKITNRREQNIPR